MEEKVNWDEVNDSVSLFSLKNQRHYAKVVSVYDGDTIKVCFPFNNKITKWNCRLSGIDTPELRTKNEEEKKMGYMVRDALRERILNKLVYVECEDFDKYGSLLVKVFTDDDDECINDWLIKSKFAFSYDGGTKKSWVNFVYTDESKINDTISEDGNAIKE